MLADDVKLDLVARLKIQGREMIDQYFTRYAQARHWRFAAGSVDRAPAMLVFDANGPLAKPAHFVILDWQSGRISGIATSCSRRPPLRRLDGFGFNQGGPQHLQKLLDLASSARRRQSDLSLSVSRHDHWRHDH